MRYAILEFYFRNGKPFFNLVASDLSLASALDMAKAWNYQAAAKGGYMEIVEDSQESFDARKALILKYHPKCASP